MVVVVEFECGYLYTHTNNQWNVDDIEFEGRGTYKKLTATEN